MWRVLSMLNLSSQMLKESTITYRAMIPPYLIFLSPFATFGHKTLTSS